MSVFRNNPFIRLLSIQLIGYLFTCLFGLHFIIILLLLLTGLIGYRLAYIHSVWLPPFLPSGFFILALLFLFFINWQIHRNKPIQITASQQIILGKLTDYPKTSTYGIQFPLKILRADSAKLNGQQIIVFSYGNDSLQLRPGDLCLLKGKIAPIENKGNPFEFDYRQYMARQNIYLRLTTSTTTIKIYPQANCSVLDQIQRLRYQLILGLKQKLGNGPEFEIASALSLGYRKELSPTTRSWFSSTGSMHVLAVSGLHVGIIYLFVDFLLKQLSYSKFIRKIRYIALAGILWFYALLTGFSPSVLRASVMFTFLIFGNALNRSSSSYNSVAASAFFLLIIHPQFVYEVGFQLSYAAVFSILFFYPRLEKLIPRKPFILRKPGQLLALSISAQIGTLPFSIYYFNQFPTYFWLSNFIVIPAAYFILLVSFSVMLLPLGTLSQSLANGLHSGIHLMIQLLQGIGDFPKAIIPFPQLKPVQLILLYSAILLLMFFIKTKRVAHLKGILLCCSLFIGVSTALRIQHSRQHLIISYHTRRPTIHLINGSQNFILYSSKDSITARLYQPVIKNLYLDTPQLIAYNLTDSIISPWFEFKQGILIDPPGKFSIKKIGDTINQLLLFPPIPRGIWNYPYLNLHSPSP